MKFKKTACIVLSALLIQTSAFASVLGSENVKHEQISIASGTNLITNSFYSDQSGVGLQTENFVEYTPNTKALPVVTSDWYLYGKRSVQQMANALLTSGIYPVALMNSDFFSFQTGVPMSHQIENGVLITKDSTIMDSIGINADGTAFIAPLKINTTVTVGENSAEIYHFNKFRQPYVAYMLNDKFSDTAKTSDPGTCVVIGSLSGDITLGSSVKGVVESVYHADGDVEIPKDKIILTVDDRANVEEIEKINLFAEGDEVTINTTAEGDERWANAKYALGCTGGRLIKNGVVQDVDESAAPRTAFGIKEDGTLIFYTIDGRQSGHSYGIRLKTLANRLKELGCVDAVNLDGGGSTTIGTIYPGNDSFSMVNKPSDGSARKVATFIGIYNVAEKTGVADKLFLYPYGGNYLSGATETFSALAADSGYYKAPLPQSLTFTAPDGSVSSDGKVKISGNGEVKVKATGGGISGEITVNCYTTPTAITVYNQDNSKAVSDISVSCKDSVNLTAKASYGKKSLIGDDSCFTWKAVSESGNIGTIDTNGYFTASDSPSKGYIEVSAGEKSVKIGVNVSAGADAYTDISFENTAPSQLKINFINSKGIGIDEDKIIIRVDGEKVTAALSSDSVNLVFGDNLSHKISVAVTNRAGLVSTAYHTFGGESYKNVFVDTASHWAKDYISYMNCYGVVNGFESGGKTVFNPSANVTRAEFAVMIANLQGIDVSIYEGKSLNVADAALVPSWAQNHVKALVDMGIMQGRENGSSTVFDPSANLTRAEAVTVISRITASGVRTLNSSFADSADIPSWAKPAFDKLSSLGVISGYEDNTVKPNNTITRAEAVKMLYEIY